MGGREISVSSWTSEWKGPRAQEGACSPEMLAQGLTTGVGTALPQGEGARGRRPSQVGRIRSQRKWLGCHKDLLRERTKFFPQRGPQQLFQAQGPSPSRSRIQQAQVHSPQDLISCPGSAGGRARKERWASLLLCPAPCFFLKQKCRPFFHPFESQFRRIKDWAGQRPG